MQAPITIVTTEDQFWTWTHRARPGDWCEYGRGLTVWQVIGTDTDGKAIWGRIPTAQAAWDAFEFGQVNLIQQRNAPALPSGRGYAKDAPFTYLAQMRPLGSPPPELFGDVVRPHKRKAHAARWGSVLR